MIHDEIEMVNAMKDDILISPSVCGQGRNKGRWYTGPPFNLVLQRRNHCLVITCIRFSRPVKETDLALALGRVEHVRGLIGIEWLTWMAQPDAGGVVSTICPAGS